MKRVTLIPHAEERLKDRGIPKELVISTIEKPDSLDEGTVEEKSPRGF